MSQITFNPSYLSGSDAERIHRVLVESGHPELAELMLERSQRTDTDRKYANALELREEGTFEMDDAPVVSASEDGAFVMVWQWVDAESAEVSIQPSFAMDIPPHNPDLVVPTDGFFDPDASNGLRAQSAHNAVLHYQEQGYDDDEHTCAIDLLTDLLHFIHSLGESPSAALDKARGHFVAEACGTAPLIR